MQGDEVMQGDGEHASRTSGWRRAGRRGADRIVARAGVQRMGPSHLVGSGGVGLMELERLNLKFKQAATPAWKLEKQCSPAALDNEVTNEAMRLRTAPPRPYPGLQVAQDDLV